MHMSIFHNLKLRLSPLRINDPDFGPLLFIFIPNAPDQSYWEGEWTFPKTGSKISIGLPGDEHGPHSAARQFYLKLPGRFEQIISAARPELQKVLSKWRQQDLPPDIFTVITLTGFGLENPKEQPLRWDISFETTGDTWLSITIPFVRDTAQPSIVDT